MTRWARSGNTQQHKKMPGDATPWEEFSTAAKINTSSKDGNVNRILKGRVEKKKHNLKKKFELADTKKFVKQFDFQSTKANKVKDLLANEASKSKFSKRKNFSISAENEGFDIAVECSSSDDERESTNNIQQNESGKIGTIVEPEKNISASPDIKNNSSLTTKALTKLEWKKAERKRKKAERKMMLIDMDIMRSSIADCKVEKNQEREFSDNASTDVISRDVSTNMDQNFEEGKDGIGNNYVPTTKLLTKRQLKKAKSNMKLIALEMLRSGRYDREVSDNHDRENVTEIHNPTSTSFLEKKKIKNSEENKRNIGSVSENTVHVSLDENDAEIMNQDHQIQKKSTENSVEALNNDVLSKNGTSECDGTTEVKKMTKKQWKTARIKRKFELLRAMQASEGKEIKSENEKDKKSPMSTSEKNPADIKKLPLEKREKKTQQNERTLLPPNVESKLSDLKKTLKGKGWSEKKIKVILRKERKHEKLKFQRTFGSKPCFNCRKIGHFLSDCPLPLGDTTQVTGVCFKCGSTEHTSYKCQKRVEGYPLAKCFICKEQGHISKDCPKNEHGVYINGGKCSLCGNVNHLSKDCPSNKKEKDNFMTVDTINEGISVDAEIIEPLSIPKKNFHKKKIVKF